MEASFHRITGEQVARLTEQGCSCEDWSKVEVADGFDASRVKKTHFSGRVRLGVFEGRVDFGGGLSRPAGISNACIHNCRIGNNVYINNVRRCICNYVVEDEAVIEDVGVLAVDGDSSFGNGTEAAVVNEAGGRAIPIFDHLSAQTAYILAFYRHRPKVVENLRKMIARYTDSVTSATGLIGRQARIVGCGILRNLRIGPAAVIEGAGRLENGSVTSSPEAPSYVGPGVSAKDFVCASGSRVTDGACILRCFVGQGTVLRGGFSAEDSVFFANCEGYRGEACSVFAGPYTVTHHKSTLLIAGFVSFFNGGSGTNQSNHMYKLGPVHQGILERGCKTASGAYILWPARVGAFTVVAGKHYQHPDSSQLPFSYLLCREGRTQLVPAVNLVGVGSARDAEKWPGRDRRKDPKKLDVVNCEMLSPYTVGRMLAGVELLEKLEGEAAEDSEYCLFRRVEISKADIREGIRLYRLGISKFLGDCLAARLADRRPGTVEQLGEALRVHSAGAGRWLDVAGMLVPEQVFEDMLGGVEAGTIHTIEGISDALAEMHRRYDDYRWAWAAEVIGRRLGKDIEQLTVAEVVDLINQWKDAIEHLDRMLLADAEKEYTETMQIGYGIDGEHARGSDFAAVRGTVEQHPFVAEARSRNAEKLALAEMLIGRLKQLR